MSTFPVIFDDGSKAMVPGEKLAGAIKDGGKLATAMSFDDGSKAYVPFSKVHDAIADGGQLLGAQPARPQVQMQQSALGNLYGGPTGNAPNQNLPSPKSQMAEQTEPSAAVGATALAGAAGTGAAYAGAAALPLIRQIAAKHPMVTAMALSEAINQARKLPGGEHIPAMAEMLPWFFGGKGEPPEGGAPVYRDATLQRSRNIPDYAGEEESSAPVAGPPTAPPAPRAAATAPAQRSIVTDPQTGRPEFSDVVAARDTRAGIPKQKTVSPAVEKQLRSAMAKASRGDVDGISPEEWDAIQHIETQVENTPKPAAQEEDLTDILNQSLAQIKARKQ